MSGNKGGMETYVREIYQTMGDHLPDVEFIGLASQNYLEQDACGWFPGTVHAAPISSTSRSQLALMGAFGLPFYAGRYKADLIHSPANFGAWSRRVPSVLTLHDVLSFAKPELFSRMGGRVIRRLVKKSARSAQHIITVSEASAQEISRFLKVDRGHISVIPLAQKSRSKAAFETQARDESLLLSVGNNLPHKNFSLLLEALALIPEAQRPSLRIVGGNPEPLRQQIRDRHLETWAEHLGWVSENELENLYSRATVLVLPTQFEGFGLPVLEAMGRGCPVACSDIPVLREVAANSAEYFAVDDAVALATTIRGLMASPWRLDELRNQGMLRASEFSWERTTRETAEVLRSALSN
jgi:glycosyltransferase involved in cell wall biosynthesis